MDNALETLATRLATAAARTESWTPKNDTMAACGDHYRKATAVERSLVNDWR